MSDNSNSLPELRHKIDQIDDRLQDLIVERTAVVLEIAQAKAQQAAQNKPNAEAGDGPGRLAMRPGREAAILRRLLSRHQGALPKKVLVRLWRELFSAKTRLQGPMTACVFGGSEPLAYWDLARFYYGSNTPLAMAESAHDVVTKVTQNGSMIGVVPAPFGSVPAPDWWPDLAVRTGVRAWLIAKLPFVFDGNETAGPVAFTLAPIPPEASGDDTTVLCVRTTGDGADGALVAALAELGWPGAKVVATGHSAQRKAPVHFCETPGFVDVNDARLTRPVAPSDLVSEIGLLGVYANPIELNAPVPSGGAP
ncbi:MAG: hypothetical protein E2O89_02175 [Alphaproteobacteria bacterium]|nr:MAG: hypothetical protein E2O89_02175 [Alphaproteobacteria bacterium]